HLECPNEQDPTQAAVRDAVTQSLRSIPEFTRLLDALVEAIWFGRYGVQLIWGWEYHSGARVLTVIEHSPVHGDLIGHLRDRTPSLMVTSLESDRIPTAEFEQPSAGGRGVVLRGTWRDKVPIHRHDLRTSDFFDPFSAEGIHGAGVRDAIYWTEFLKQE